MEMQPFSPWDALLLAVWDVLFLAAAQVREAAAWLT
jgi:hypothetical protein